MPHSRTNYVDNPIWDDPKKVQSRHEAIISAYQKHTGNSSLPADKQYWTICGAHYSKTDTGFCPVKGELGQLLDEHFITENQFHGVDINPEIIEKNRLFYPNINWFCGDFCDTIEEHIVNGKFNPGFINFDTPMQTKFGIRHLKRLMQLIDHNIHDGLVLSANFMLNNPYRSRKGIDGVQAIEHLLKIYYVPDHWTLDPEYYRYYGTGDRSHSVMGTFIFVKKKHSKIEISTRDLCIS
jgi:hypothetical protein